MKRMSMELVSSKPISLSRTSKLLSRFAAAGYVTSPVVNNYLNRTVEAYASLVQFHNKPVKSDGETSQNNYVGMESLEKEVESKIGVERTDLEGDLKTEVKVGDEEEKRKKKKRKKVKNDSVEKKKTKSGAETSTVS